MREEAGYSCGYQYVHVVAKIVDHGLGAADLPAPRWFSAGRVTVDVDEESCCHEVGWGNRVLFRWDGAVSSPLRGGTR